MDSVWLTAPAAALCVSSDAAPPRVQPNEAARRLGAALGLADTDWQALAGAALRSGTADADEVELGARGVRLHWRRVALGDGRSLLWLEPAAGEAVQRLAAAQRTADFLERALQLAGVAVWRLDLKRQRVFFDAAGVHVEGLAPDAEGVSLPVLRGLVHPQDRDAIARATEEAAASDRIVDVVVRYRRRDGSWRPTLTRRVAERDETGAVVALAGVSLDMSAQVAERERAEDLAERQRLVADAMGIGFWSRDLDSGSVHWDAGMYRIHGRDPGAGPPALDEWVDLYVHPADRAWMRARRDHANRAWERELDVVFRQPDDGSGERWVQSWTRRVERDGRRLAFGMHRDVTERERTRAMVERERARTQFALDVAEVGVWERGLDGGIGYWSPGMYRLRGLEPSDPRPPDQIIVETTQPDDHRVLAEVVRQHVEQGRPYQGEFRVRWPDGAWRWLATRGGALRDGDGRLLGMAGINIDITERKHADELRLQKERAEQANRDKSAFMARVSHELRTPMNAVLGFTRLLEDDPADPLSASQRARLQRIAEAGTTMMLLVDDLLGLAGLEADPAPANALLPLAEVVRQALELLAGLAQLQGVTLRAGPLTDAGAVRADRRRLAQLLRHLGRLALRRQPRGGSVEIDAGLDRSAQLPQALIVIRDDGPPFGAAERMTLTEPMAAQTRAAADGDVAGVALSLAVRLAAAMGGAIEIESRPEGGNQLRLRLPAADDESEAPLAPAAPLAPGAPEVPALTVLTVLCVEDNPVNLLLVRELLALRPGVRLHEAVDGLGGVAQALAERPDLLLLDLQLPDIGGLEVLRRLRAEPAMAGCTYVALSADAMPGHIASARAAGFDDYWTKPIDFERFLAGIDRLIAAKAAAPTSP
jgi:PAS domain S-box-containing protein